MPAEKSIVKYVEGTIEVLVFLVSAIITVQAHPGLFLVVTVISLLAAIEIFSLWVYYRPKPKGPLIPQEDKQRYDRFHALARVGMVVPVIVLLVLVFIPKTASFTKTTLLGGPTASPTPLPRVWKAPFSIKFAPGYWSEGDHTYLFSADCPAQTNSTGPNEREYTFTVSSAYTLLNTPIYLRRGGLYSEPSGTDNKVQGVNPAEVTIAVYTPYLISYEDALTAQAGCKVTIKVDGQEIKKLIAETIQHIK